MTNVGHERRRPLDGRVRRHGGQPTGERHSRCTSCTPDTPVRVDRANPQAISSACGLIGTEKSASGLKPSFAVCMLCKYAVLNSTMKPAALLCSAPHGCWIRSVSEFVRSL